MIKLNIKDDIISNVKSAQMHLMPFRINHDGSANVSKYFTSYMKTSDEGLEASFRGYPLKGKSIKLPEGFKGLIFTEPNKTSNDKEERNFFLNNKFSEITFWNYDKLPSKNDAIISAMDWIDVAHAIHSEDVEDEVIKKEENEHS